MALWVALRIGICNCWEDHFFIVAIISISEKGMFLQGMSYSSMVLRSRVKSDNLEKIFMSRYVMFTDWTGIFDIGWH